MRDGTNRSTDHREAIAQVRLWLAYNNHRPRRTDEFCLGSLDVVEVVRGCESPQEAVAEESRFSAAVCVALCVRVESVIEKFLACGVALSRASQLNWTSRVLPQTCEWVCARVFWFWTAKTPSSGSVGCREYQ